jgi:hypothetical protein
MNIQDAANEDSAVSEVDAALAELERQGLTIRLHSVLNSTWHIADGGLYSGYVVSESELIELGRTGKLNIRGIMDLG